MCSTQVLCRFSHAVYIKRFRIIINISALEYLRYFSCMDPVKIGLFHCLISAVETLIHSLYFTDRNIFRKVLIQIK